MGVRGPNVKTLISYSSIGYKQLADYTRKQKFS